MAKIKFPIEMEGVVPHRAPMMLLRRVLSHKKGYTVCDVQIEPSSLFLADGRIEAWIGLEYMAQAVAAHAGMEARLAGAPVQIGFLLGTRRVDFFTEAYALGQTLHVSARHVWGDQELFCFDCAIIDPSNGRCLAAAQLNVFRPDKAPRNSKRKKK